MGGGWWDVFSRGICQYFGFIEPGKKLVFSKGLKRGENDSKIGKIGKI